MLGLRMRQSVVQTMATTDYSISTLPANVEAERSILGAILLDNFAYNQAAEHLRIEDFSLDSHRRIYSRMVDLAESSRPIDMITLIEELDRHKDLQPIGDVAYVSSLVDGVPDRPSIEHYVKIVRDKALLRGLISAASTAIARAIGSSGRGRGCSERCRGGDLSAVGEAHWARVHGRAGDRPRDRLGRSMRCCSVGSGLRDWRRTTPIWTR